MIVEFVDDEGNEQEAAGETLAEVSGELARQGYEGPPIRVLNEHGFTEGWVSATNWRAT